MKQKEIIRAYKAINNFNQNEKNKQNASVRVTHDLFVVRKLLEPHWQYQTELEQGILADAEAEWDNGKWKFKSTEKAKLFYDKLREVSNLDVDLGEFTKAKINLDENIYLSMDDMDALDPFVEFVG